MSSRQTQRGFALLLTLVLVLIAGAALAVVVRRGSVAALETQDAADELQRRWAVTSCRSTILPMAGVLLDQATAQAVADDDPPSAEMRFEIELAGTVYELVIADEQAKYNPNLMLGLTDERQARSAIRSLANPRGALVEHTPGVLLRRQIDTSEPRLGNDEGDQPASLYSFGQLFDGATPAWLRDSEAAPASRITCWGDGRLHVRRADDAVLRHAFNTLVEPDAINALLEARRNEPDRSLKELLNGLSGVNPTDRAVFGAVLTEQSTSHGLWVIARGKTRSWYAFSAQVEPVGEAAPVAVDGSPQHTTHVRVQGATSYVYEEAPIDTTLDEPTGRDLSASGEAEEQSGIIRLDFQW